MATQKHSACAPVRSQEVSKSEVTPHYTQLEAAALEAGQYPERAAVIAQQLQIGKQTPSALGHALRGEGFPPPTYDGWFDPPPAGAFDAGIARVMGEQYVTDFAEWVRARGMQFVGLENDPTKAVSQEVRRSYGFARFAIFLANGIRLAEDDGDTEAKLLEAAESDLASMAATAFLAGWYMALEHAAVKRFDQDAATAKAGAQ